MPASWRVNCSQWAQSMPIIKGTWFAPPSFGDSKHISGLGPGRRGRQTDTNNQFLVVDNGDDAL